MKNILVIDEGTTSTRAAIYNDKLSRTEFFQYDVPLISPTPDVVEQDGQIIWQKTFEAIKNAIENGIDKDDKVNCIGITNQRETTILWERDTGNPIHNAIIWQDRRGIEFCEKLKTDGLEKILSDKTGLLADPYFSAFKIRYLLDNIDGLRERCVNGEIAFGNIDTWIIWNLTRGRSHATDATNASRTGIFNIHTNKWDDELLKIFDIPRHILPDVRDSAAYFGECILFDKPIPINGILGDQQSALMGQNCTQYGQAKITFGTGAFLMVQFGETTRASGHKMLLTIASRIKGKTNYALEGSILNAGTAIQYLRDELGILSTSKDSEEIAKSVPDNGGVYFVPAFTGLGAPHWDSDARGMIYGLGRKTGRAHIIRAAIEASAYQTRDLLDALAKDGIIISTLRIDGGMANNEFFCQFLSDICNIEVQKPKDLEMTAMGAAKIANIDAADIKIPSHTYYPQMDNETRNKALKGWRAAIIKCRA